MVRNEGGKGLVEPEIVPPLHSDKVAKPVMRKFMTDDRSKGKHFAISDFFFEEAVIPKDDSACIFHG